MFIAEHKPVNGISREFAATTDQSGRNRWLRAAPWAVARIKQQRLEWLQTDPTTRYRQDGASAIDNPRSDHAGTLIADASWCWDHADARYLIAHDHLFAKYVQPSGKHDPLPFRRFRKRADCQDQKPPFKSHTDLCSEVIDWVVEQDMPGAFTFDRSVTTAEILNHSYATQRTDGGDLKANRPVRVDGQECKRNDGIAPHRLPACRRKITGAGHPQW